jgi:hypothetical protein
VESGDLARYVQSGGETFERYGLADYAYNFTVMKSFYTQATSQTAG